MALGGGPNKHTLQVFRASKAKTPVTYSKNGLRAPRNTKKAHCKGVGGFFFLFFCLFSCCFVFFNRDSDPGSRVPGSVCFSSYWFRTPGLVGKGWARMNQGGIVSDDSLLKIGGWSRKVWFGGQ